MHFEQASFTEGLPLAANEKPYDLYFTSYGTWSHHNDDETAVQLLAQIAERVEHYCVIVCDWLGRYSYEWQDLWVHDPAERGGIDRGKGRDARGYLHEHMRAKPPAVRPE